jgi:molybdopterin-binding protein
MPGWHSQQETGLRARSEEVVLGTVMSHVVVRVGDNLIESAITRHTRFYQQI